MSALRRFLAQPHLAALLCAATLLVRLLVPGGYMIAVDHGRPTIVLCSGVAMPARATDGAEAHAGVAGHAPAREGDKAEMPCAFAGLSMAALGTVDPVQLVALLAFIAAIGLLPTAPPVAVRRHRLRPPLRAPPLLL